MEQQDVVDECWPLPQGWTWTTVGDLWDVVGGGTPSTEVDDYWTGTLPWITSADIHGLQDIRPRRHITERAVEESATSLVPVGTLIVVTRVALGKVALARFPLCFSQDSQGLVGGNDRVFPEYALYYLSQAVQSFKHSSRGTTIAGVTKKQLKELPFPLASLPEQHRIVTKIEELFSDLDAGVAALKRVQASLKRYRASVLKAACEGRLVPTEAELAREEGRAYESADVLLKCILAERRAKWEAEHPGKKYVEPTTPNTDGLPELPDGWSWASFDQLLCELKNGFFGGKPNTEPPGKPLLRVSAVRPMSVSFDDLRYLPDVDGETETQYRLQEGDLLFTRYNGSLNLVGACGLVRRAETDALYPDKLIRARVVATEVLPSYLEVFFNTDIARRFIERSAKTTAGQYGIAGGELRRSVIALPPFVEQRRIVAEVERRLSVVTELEATVAANLARAGRLRQAVLKRAFEGRLVAQDPSDGLAEAVLAGIRATRATVGATGRSPLRRAGQLPLPGTSR